jgi:hypothetical protein
MVTPRADPITEAQVGTTALTKAPDFSPTMARKSARNTTFNPTITAPTVHRVNPTKAVPVRTTSAGNNPRTAETNSISGPATLTACESSGASLLGQASIKA